MDEEKQAQQALMEMFRQDQVKVAAHPAREPRWSLGPLALPWLIAIAIVVFILGPYAFVVIYPRFGPVDTLTAFCKAETDGEYATAYALLSKRAQQQMSLPAFTQASRNSNLVTCSEQLPIPFILGGTQASLDAYFEFVDGTGHSNQTDGSVTFVREHGEWRVDTVTSYYLNLPS
jgi:hypothetical protein